MGIMPADSTAVALAEAVNTKDSAVVAGRTFA
jgi:hypothetical protein